MESDRSNSRSAAAVEWLLVFVVVGLIVLVGIFLAGSAGKEVAMLVATSTASPTTQYSPTPSFTPTKTLTPSSTPTPTETLTPSPTPTDTPTPRAPLPGVAETVTPLPTPEVITEATTLVPTPAPIVDLPGDTINVVVLGSDRRPGDGSWRTDTIILVSVHQNPTFVTLLSIPRDLWVYVPNWRYNRINVADSHGERNGFPGAGLVKQTIQYNLGIEVQYFIRIDFNAFRAIIDTLGTVREGDDKPTIRVLADCPLIDIFPDVPEGQTDIISGDALSTTITGTLEIVPGYNYLDSKHALWYSRSRLSTNDFDRSRRILNLGLALQQAARENGTFGKVPELWNHLSASIQTDLTLNDVLWLAGIVGELDPSAIKLRQIDSVVTQSFVAEEGAQVLRINPEVLALVLAEAFAPPPANAASQASAAVEVWNASGFPDWDDLAIDRLLRYNFEVVGSPNSDADRRADTMIVDYSTTSKGSRVSQLARLFQVPAGNIVSQPDPNSPVAYRLIVGASYDPCRKPPAPVEVTPTPSPTPTMTPTIDPALLTPTP
jgi:anionic cell wall polymer biosynthesis LytR-Cps2A-Psr (LCP) family protein